MNGEVYLPLPLLQGVATPAAVGRFARILWPVCVKQSMDALAWSFWYYCGMSDLRVVGYFGCRPRQMLYFANQLFLARRQVL